MPRFSPFFRRHPRAFLRVGLVAILLAAGAASVLTGRSPPIASPDARVEADGFVFLAFLEAGEVMLADLPKKDPDGSWDRWYVSIAGGPAFVRGDQGVGWRMLGGNATMNAGELFPQETMQVGDRLRLCSEHPDQSLRVMLRRPVEGSARIATVGFVFKAQPPCPSDALSAGQAT